MIFIDPCIFLVFLFLWFDFYEEWPDFTICYRVNLVFFIFLIRSKLMFYKGLQLHGWMSIHRDPSEKKLRKQCVIFTTIVIIITINKTNQTCHICNNTKKIPTFLIKKDINIHESCVSTKRVKFMHYSKCKFFYQNLMQCFIKS